VVGQGLVIAPHRPVGQGAVVDGRGVSKVELDGAVEVGQGPS
jgi:hypothetical protein